MKKNALITGAGSGIGKATALLLAKNGYNIIAVGRRPNLLLRLQNEIQIQSKSMVLPVSLDVRDPIAVINTIRDIPKSWKHIDLLINNAGLASGLDLIHEGDFLDWDTMIDTNIKGLLYMSREVSKGMVKRKKGHIVNISSSAGKGVYAKGNVYCATKHAVEALSKAMRIDLLPFNIKVSVVAPGMAETEFSKVRFHGDIKRAKEVYQGFKPLSAKDIAEAILFTVTRPAHVCINELNIMPAAQADATTLRRT